MSQFLKIAALVAVSTLFAFAIGEFVLRRTGAERLYINQDQLEFWTHDPLLGWAHRPGQEGVFEMSSRFSTHVSVNRKGLRDVEHEYQRSGDRKRVLVIGDSFGWGFGVNHSERFSELLESSMDIEVINASVSGYSTDQQLLWLRHEGVKYDVDLILLVFCGNDEHDNHVLRHYIVYNKPRFELAGDTLALRGVPVPKPAVHPRLERFLRQKSVLVNRLAHEIRGLHTRFLLRFEATRTIHTRVLRQPEPPYNSWMNQEPPFALTRGLLSEIREVARARDAAFMIVSTPRYWMNVPAPRGSGRAEGTYQDLMQSLRADGFLLLDVESGPGWDRNGMTIPRDGHWNAAGHEFLAGEVQRFIARHRLLDDPANHR
jgi:lysophospholipase L1-like esterase